MGEAERVSRRDQEQRYSQVVGATRSEFRGIVNRSLWGGLENRSHPRLVSSSLVYCTSIVSFKNRLASVSDKRSCTVRRPTRVTAAGCVTAMFSRPAGEFSGSAAETLNAFAVPSTGVAGSLLHHQRSQSRTEGSGSHTVHATWSMAAHLDPSLRVGRGRFLGATRVEVGKRVCVKWRCSQR